MYAIRSYYVSCLCQIQGWGQPLVRKLYLFLELMLLPAAALPYRFDWQTPIIVGKLYSPHTIEIPFVFDNACTEAGAIMTGGEAGTAVLARNVSDVITSYSIHYTKLYETMLESKS